VANKVMSVADLARKAGIDADEALIDLWDVELLRYKGPNDRLRRQDADAAMRAVGVPTRSDLTLPDYWIGRLGLEGLPVLRERCRREP
jgi:hypothetical protein